MTITNETEYEEALATLYELMKDESGSSDEKIESLSAEIEEYEKLHYPMLWI